MITLRSDDNQDLTVSKDISNMIETIDQTKDGHDFPIKMSSLKFIVDYCEYHSFMNPPEIIKPLLHNDFTKCISDPKDADLVLKLGIEKCFELVNDCHLIKCFALFKLLCARIAHFFKVTPIQEIKQIFSLTATKFNKADIDELLNDFKCIDE